jgi:hypothetical protein
VRQQLPGAAHWRAPAALQEANHLGQIGHEAAFFREVDVVKEDATLTAMYQTLNPEQSAFVDKAYRCLQHQVARREALKNRTPLARHS